MLAKGQSAPNVSHTESIQMFRPCHRKDSHRPLPALFDFVRMPKNPVEVSLYRAPPKTLLTIPLLAKYYSANTSGCNLGLPILGPTLSFLLKVRQRKEVARLELAASFTSQKPVTEDFVGNLAEVFRSSAAHYSK